jgi:chorismate-pyruvate lyase
VAFLGQLCGFDASSLDLLQRVLLACDGTLTDTLEAALLEPIVLHKIALNVAPARVAIVALEVDPGAEIMERKILLRGETSGRNYVYAESLLVLDRLAAGFRKDLVESNVPLGRLWSDHRLETWKELLSVERGPMGALAEYFTGNEGDVLTRQYRVISGGRPLMLITESFPVVY